MTTTPDTSWPSQHAGSARLHVARADGLRSRRLLLAAAADRLATGQPFTLTEVAAAAGLSAATAYRHFESADEITDAYVAGFWDDMDARVEAADGVPALPDLCDVWVAAVLQWGPAIAYLRSREGFLARRRRGDARVGRMLRVCEPTIRAELESIGVAVTEPRLSHALALWNALADPRELIDQADTLGWPPARVSRELCTAARAAVATGR